MQEGLGCLGTEDYCESCTGGEGLGNDCESCMYIPPLSRSRPVGLCMWAGTAECLRPAQPSRLAHLKGCRHHQSACMAQGGGSIDPGCNCSWPA